MVGSSVLWAYRRDGSWWFELRPCPVAGTSFHPSTAHLKSGQSEQSFLHVQKQMQGNGCDPSSQTRSCGTISHSSVGTQPSPHLQSFHSGEVLLITCKIFLNTSCYFSLLAPNSWTASLKSSLTLHLPGSISLEGHTCFPYPLFFLHINEKCALAAKSKILIFLIKVKNVITSWNFISDQFLYTHLWTFLCQGTKAIQNFKFLEQFQSSKFLDPQWKWIFF